MLHTPSSSPRAALAPRTNTLDARPHDTPRLKTINFLPTPPADGKSKRRTLLEEDNKPTNKRIKLSQTIDEDTDSDSEVEEDEVMDDAMDKQARARRNTAFRSRNDILSGPPTGCRRLSGSTLSVLRSFVSSNKSDIFKCSSIGLDTYLTPPYACSYSHGAKSGRVPYLAVATEQGTVHVLDTSKRTPWGSEPSRSTFQTHNNGIFDIKWNADDTALATCSGDQSVRISDAHTGSIVHVLHGHDSTVKCVVWDPTNTSLLATGGRDGSISLWDLRTSSGRSDDDNLTATRPTSTIYGAHEDIINKSKPKPRKGKHHHAPRTITGLLFPELQPYGLISSGSYDGILRCWDLRKPISSKKCRSTKRVIPAELYSSPVDPATMHGSKRPRGIISLANGSGPSAGLIFAIATDSKVHIYDLPTLTAQSSTLSHDSLQASTFYVGLSISPCGRWLACGGSAKKGNNFVFDIENAGRPGYGMAPGVEFKGHTGDVGAVDWAQDSLATCLDDGIVRIWRPDTEVYSDCMENPEESQWDWMWSA